MARSSGTYTLPSNNFNPAVQGETLDPDDWNTTAQDIEDALTESVYTGGLGSTDNRLVRTDGTDTKKVQGTGITVDDNDYVTGVHKLEIVGTEAGGTGVISGTISSGDADHWFRLSAGATTDYRCYFAWYEYTQSSHRWLMGRNAANTFVLYDNSGSSHRLEAPSGGSTYISGSGTGGVVCGQNLVDNGAGTGGFEVRDGSTSEALMFAVKTTGISAAQKVSIATSSGGQLVCERTGSDLNAHIEYKGSGGSIYAGKYGSGFRIGSAADLASSNLFTVTTGGDVGINGVTSPTAELHVSGTIKHSTYTVGTLPTASAVGAGTRAAVTDANATTFNAVVAGGGANFVPVISDGTNWRIG